jgi:hypothetical protein
MKKAKTTPSAGKIMANIFLGLSKHLIYQNNEPSMQLIICSFLKTEESSISFKTMRSISQCPTVYILSHPAYSPDLTTSNIHLFYPFRDALGGKKDSELMMKLKTFCTTMVGKSTTHFFGKRHNEAAQIMLMVYRGAERLCPKTGITF